MRPVKVVLPIALCARAEGKTGVLVPAENAPEAAVVAGLQVIPVRNLREAVGFLEGVVQITSTRVDAPRSGTAGHGKVGFGFFTGKNVRSVAL